MLESKDSKAKLLLEINTIDNSKELLNIYKQSNWAVSNVLYRLLSIRSYSDFLLVWNQHYDNIKINEIEIVAFSAKDVKDIAESEVAEEFLRHLLSLAEKLGVSYETYKICLLCSDLIQAKKRVVEKNWMIQYFTLVAKLFIEASLPSSYVNALYILNEYQPVQISKQEVDFYVNLAKLKADLVVKDLFCGIKTRPIESIVLPFNDESYVVDTMWNQVFDLKIDNSIENLAFLHKNNLIYQINGKHIEITPGTSSKFVSNVFGIANKYRVSSRVYTKKEIVEKKAEEKAVILTKPQQQMTNKVEFKNIFSTQYRKLKLIYKYAHLEFTDVHFDERSLEREDRQKNISSVVQKEKDRLLNYKETINELKVQLKKKLEEKAEADREKQREQQRIDEEALAEERRALQWRNSVVKEKITEVTPYRPSSSNYRAQSIEHGIYKPNFAVIDSKIKSRSAVFTKSEATTDSESKSWKRKSNTGENKLN